MIARVTRPPTPSTGLPFQCANKKNKLLNKLIDDGTFIWTLWVVFSFVLPSRFAETCADGFCRFFPRAGGLVLRMRPWNILVTISTRVCGRRSEEGPPPGRSPASFCFGGTVRPGNTVVKTQQPVFRIAKLPPLDARVTAGKVDWSPTIATLVRRWTLGRREDALTLALCAFLEFATPSSRWTLSLALFLPKGLKLAVLTAAWLGFLRRFGIGSRSLAF